MQASGQSRTRAEPISNKIVCLDEAMQQRGLFAMTDRYNCSGTFGVDFAFEDKVLGTGMSGDVRLGRRCSTGRLFAVKSFQKDKFPHHKVETLKREAEIHLSLDHPHVASLEHVYETDTELHLVLEYLEGGEMTDRLAACGTFSEPAAATAVRQMLCAMSYLHAHKIAHRDLKLQNFVYEHKNCDQIKLIDFGLAKRCNNDKSMSTVCGTHQFMAPEVYRRSYTEKADVWSLGITSYMLLCGCAPFRGSRKQILNSAKAGKPYFCHARFEPCSREAKDFVKALLCRDPEKRPAMSEALRHPWLRSLAPVARGVDVAVVRCLRDFAQAPPLRRACLAVAARSLSPRLSPHDQQMLREQFLAIDRDGSGTITKDELERLLEPELADELFRGLDANGDGEVAYGEFLSAALQQRVDLEDSTLRLAFTLFDAQGDGEITAEGFRKALGRPCSRQDPKHWISEADEDGNGSLSLSEFLAYNASCRRRDTYPIFLKTVEDEPALESMLSGTPSRPCLRTWSLLSMLSQICF